MTTSYLDRKPNARGKSVAWRTLRDAKTAQLAAETKAARGWKMPKRFYVVRDFILGRSGR